MNAHDSAPTEEQLLVMAYADGELRGEKRREFEALLASRADLRDELSQLRRLAVLARQAAGPEPMDLEWRVIDRDPAQRVTLGVGWFALFVGALGLLGFVLWSLWTSDAAWIVRISVTALIAGFTLLLVAALRARRRTTKHDPYTSVQR